MRSPWLLVLTLLLASLVACTPPEERAENARAAFQDAMTRGDRPGALQAVKDLRESAPDTAEALLEVARRLVQAGSAPDAAWLLEEGMRRYPDRDDVRLALGQVALVLGNPSLAHEAVEPIAAGSQQHAAALIARGRAELHLGDLERALATLAEAERLYPEHPEARLVRIATLLSEHRQDEARAAIEEARAALASAGEEQADIRRRLDVTLAQIQAQQGEPEAALAALEAMVEADASDLLAWRALVQVLVQQKRAEDALTRLEAALAAAEPPRDLLPLAAQVYTALGHEDEAEAALRSFVARSESAGGYLPLVDFLSTQGSTDAMMRVVDDAIERYPDEPMLSLLRTESLLAQERLDDARAESARFREVTFDGDPQVEYLRARLDLAEGDAGSAADRLTKLAPRLDRATTQFWLGRALEESGDIEGARRRYSLAQQRDRKWTAPAAALIALEGRRGDWRAVVAQAQRIVRRAPQEMGAWVALVEAMVNLREGEAAERVARQTLERFPDRFEPHGLLARALRAQGRTDEALAALDKVGAGATSALAAERVLTLGMGGRLEEGIALARAALASEPESASLHAALGSLLFAAGAAEEGAQATDRALALAPDEPRPLRVRCEFRVATGGFDGARYDCTRYLEARPDDAGAHFMLGLAYDGLGDGDEAIAAYRRAAKLDERDIRSRNNLAELLASSGDLDGALDAAQAAYHLDETNPYVMDTLGALYLRKGLAERSISLLEEARAGLPDLPDVTLHLALAYRDAGRSDDARALLTDLQEISAGNETLARQVEKALLSLP